MVNSYSSPAATTKQRVPVVRPVSWPATILQLLVLAAAVAIGWYVTRSSDGVFWGAAVYLIYSLLSRKLIARAHQRGLRLLHNQQYGDAIHAYAESYEFFTRHPWIDRYRSITMMSVAAMSYREMALISIAFAYSQLGDGKKAKDYYQRALEEFPDSGMASAALKMIDSIERSHVEVESDP